MALAVQAAGDDAGCHHGLAYARAGAPQLSLVHSCRHGFSLAGDVFPMLSPRWYVAGLLGFLVAHVWCIAAFVNGKPIFAKPLEWLLCVAHGALRCRYCDGRWRCVSPCIFMSRCQRRWRCRAGWIRAQRDPHVAQAVLVAIGALVFMPSDSPLAWNRFMTTLPLSAAAVLGTYYVALWLSA